MFKLFSKKEKKRTIQEFDYVNATFEEILLNEKSFQIENKYSFEQNQFERAFIRPEKRHSHILSAKKILENYEFVTDLDLDKNLSIRDDLDVIEQYGMKYLESNNLEKSFEIAVILFKQESSYKHFMSCHFFFNHFVETFYKKRDDINFKEKLIMICKYDFALTNRYKIMQDVILPCITKLVQLLEYDKKFNEALYVIDVYKNNGYIRHYQNELLPKELRIKKKFNEKEAEI